MVLLAVLIPILLATAVAMIALWPHGSPKTALNASVAGITGDVVPATVRSSSATTCAGDSGDRLPDGTIPQTATCASMVVRLLGGTDKGQQVRVAVPPEIYASGIAPGDRVNVTKYPPLTGAAAATLPGQDSSTVDNSNVYAWGDFARGFPLGILAIAFAVLVIAVARLRGFAAIGGLAIAYLAIIKFMLPALRLGESAIAVALVGSIAVMTVVLYLAHGVSAKTTTALLGTFFGLALTAGLAGWATSAAHLNGLSSEENHTLTQILGTPDLSGIILCGIIVAGLGVLNDVTVTQASAVWEVHIQAPHLGVRELFVSGMRVGRDHLASTVYTIAFAYAGAALPTLILIDLYQQPLGQVITGGQIAEEIVRTLVGSIGLILAIPVTTIVAALVVVAGQSRAGVSGPADPFPALVPSPGRRAARHGGA